MEAITASQYFCECRDIAREIVEECAGDEERIHDRQTAAVEPSEP